jgi:hypothetical protein
MEKSKINRAFSISQEKKIRTCICARFNDLVIIVFGFKKIVEGYHIEKYGSPGEIRTPVSLETSPMN